MHYKWFVSVVEGGQYSENNEHNVDETNENNVDENNENNENNEKHVDAL